MDNIRIAYEKSHEKKRMDRHFHNAYEIILILDGSAVFNINMKEYEVECGNLVFISHLESHELTVTKYPYERFYIIIDPGTLHNLITDSRLTSILKKRPEGFSHTVKLDDAEFELFKKMFTEIYSEYSQPHDFSALAISAQLQLFFAKLYKYHASSFPVKTTSGSTGIINEVQQYIDEHFMETININEISKLFYIDIYYLSHLFKKVCGYSMKDYLILQRISKAKELLMRSDKAIPIVCSASGFGNTNHFIRIFKKNEGITPYQYRKKYMSSSL